MGDTRSSEAWRTIKNLRKSTKNENYINSISDNQWNKHFKELLMETRRQFLREESLEEQTTNDNITIHISEVKEVVKAMKLGKSPGIGGIYPELVKYGPEELFVSLAKMFQRCINGEGTPEEWRTSYIAPIYKKGNRNNSKNYRGIAVISTIGRVYAKIIKNRVEKEIEHKQPEEQAGFRTGRSTIDNIFTIKIACEKRVQRNRELHIALIDLEKAYDSVPISQLWKALTEIELSSTLIQAIKHLYEGNTSRVKNGKVFTEPFHTTKGLRQGCSLSPTLFKIYLDKALTKWTNKVKAMGLQVGEEKLYSLYFADDQVVIAEDHDDLNYMIRKLQEEFEAAGLTINMEKSEYLIVGDDQQEDLVLENGTIKGVSTCKYLGIKLNKHGNSNDEIKERVNKGKKTIQSLNSFLWDKNITIETKKRLYKSIVQTITTYGAETWDMTKRNRSKLMTMEMDYLRRSCRRSKLEKIRNETIRENMNMATNIVEDIEKKQLVWFGHTKRMNDMRWPRRILEWVPAERRKRGRPRRSWRDDIDEAMIARNLEEEMCYNRREWRLGTEKWRSP